MQAVMWSSKPENQKQPATKVSLTAVDSKAVSRTETEQNPNGYGDVTNVNELDWGEEFLAQLHNALEILGSRPHFKSSIESDINDFYQNALEKGQASTTSVLENEKEDQLLTTLSPNPGFEDILHPTKTNLSLNDGDDSDRDGSICTNKVSNFGQHVTTTATTNEVINNMLHWYICSSVCDLMLKIRTSSHEEIPSLVECLLDLPLEDNKWCWEFLKSQIYDKLMRTESVTVAQQVSFWTTINMMNSPTAHRLVDDLQYQIGLTFKEISQGEHILLMDADQKPKIRFYRILKFALFVSRIFIGAILSSSQMIDNLLHASQHTDDVMSLSLLLAVLNEIYSDNLETILLPESEDAFMPPLSFNQKAMIQIFAQLKAVVDTSSHVLPPSIVKFIKGLVLHKTDLIHFHWKKSGEKIMNQECAVVLPESDAVERSSSETNTLDHKRSRRRKPKNLRPGSPRFYRIASTPRDKSATESLLQCKLINEFYSWLIDRYQKLLAHELLTKP